MTTTPKNVTDELRQKANAKKADHQPEANSTNSTSSTGESARIFFDAKGEQPTLERIHPVPDDSLLSDYIKIVRDISEAPDAWLVAPILSLCGRLMTPNVKLSLGSLKPLTMFQFIAGPAGLRKSTSFAPAESLARELLDDDAQLSGVASDSALFLQFEQNPHRLQFEDEGNTLLKTWSNGSFGGEAAARYLKLYDGRPWTQSFRKDASKDSPDIGKSIDHASLSLCVGATLGVAKLDGISASSGLRRRFGFYLATKSARLLTWPTHFVADDHPALLEGFAKLQTLNGIVGPSNLTAAAKEVWARIQRDNRAQAEALGYSAQDETLAASLNESPARILKLAIIFQACLWAKGRASNPFTVTSSMLELADAHQSACIDSLADIERLSTRAATSENAESIIDVIRAEFDRAEYLEGGAIVLSKSEITRRFAANPGRNGSLTPSILYTRILPELMRRGDAMEIERNGKLVRYAFRRE